MPRAVFLKAHGTAENPLADHWLQAGSRLIDPGRTAFPRRPRLTSGDRLVLYASVWQRLFGIAEAIGVAPRSMSQHSHIRLEARHLELAIEALAGVGRCERLAELDPQRTPGRSDGG